MSSRRTAPRGRCGSASSRQQTQPGPRSSSAGRSPGRWRSAATVSFTVAQAVAAAEAVERGLDRRAAAGGDVAGMTPMVVLMIGRLDDWLKAVIERAGLAIDPACLLYT